MQGAAAVEQGRVPVEPVVALRNIHKRFGGVHALRGVDLDLYPGEVLGLVGDNAAGKSTLMKVLSGRYQPDEGEIIIAGERRTHLTPEESRRLGIEMIYQDFALVNTLDATANIFLGRELVRNGILGRLGFRDDRRMRAEAERILRNLDIQLPSLHSPVQNMSGGQRQAIAIARAVMFDPKVIIMDEPTANLAVGKVGQLLQLIRRLKAMNVACILISHRLQEIMEVGDRVMVLRRGQCVGVRRVQETTVDELVKLMIGVA